MSDTDVREIVGPEPAPSPVRRDDFKPWHRPRKQYIRSQLWCALLRQLLDGLAGTGHSRLVKYLGLPGEDMLDIREFHDAIKTMGDEWRLRYLAFERSGSASQVLTESATLDLPLLDQASRCCPDGLETLGKTDSASHAALREYGDADVINIDLCDAVFPPSRPAILEALRTLVDHQLRTRAVPWLLLLTTRVDPGSMHSDAHVRLLGCVRSNVEQHAEFADRLSVEMQMDVASLQELIQHIEGHNRRLDGPLGQVNLPATALGIAKWLLTLVGQVPWTLTVPSAYYYSIQRGRPDMVAMAFRFEMHQPVLQDPSGLTHGIMPQAMHPDEGQAACGLIPPVSQMVDVDAIITGDLRLRAKLIDRSAALLVRAGHNDEAYRSWVARFPS